MKYLKSYPKKKENKIMRLNKKIFKQVCQSCMNSRKIPNCPSKTCLLAPLKDGKKFKASIQLLKDFCKSCDPEGFKARAKCQTVPKCPLEAYFNEICKVSDIRGLTHV